MAGSVVAQAQRTMQGNSGILPARSSNWKMNQRPLSSAYAELKERGRYLLNDLLHLRIGRVKRRWIVAASPLDCVGIDLRLGGIDQMTAEGVIIRRARGRI